MTQTKQTTLIKEHEDSNELYLLGDIGLPASWTDGSMFNETDVKEILMSADSKKPLNIYLNSAGGSVFDALSIRALIEHYPSAVTILVTGIAASAATLITSAKNARVVMAKGSLLMIHNPMTRASGNQHDLRKRADVLEQIARQMQQIYMQRTGLSEEKLTALMDAETWLSAEDAVAQGFADEIDGATKVTACISNKFFAIGGLTFDRSLFGTVPNFLNRNLEDDKQMPEQKKITAEAPITEVVADVATLTAKYPELVAKIRTQAINEERERIKKLDEYSDIAPQEILNDAKYTNPISAEECAVKVLMAQKEAKAQALNNLRADGAQAAREMESIDNHVSAITKTDDTDQAANMILNAMRGL